ncbi:MAG: hypothetical protein IKX86_07160 [Clostridia bacterium]|nr:hypothetical protein [Clostridia bacterium]
MKNRFFRVFFAVFIAALVGFAATVVFALRRTAVCVRDNKEYDRVLTEEFVGPDDVAALYYDEESDRIYVCYDTATYVNVYGGDGAFLWAVSTPSRGYEVFFGFDSVRSEITVRQNDEVGGDFSVYVYDLKTGSFKSFFTERYKDPTDGENDVESSHDCEYSFSSGMIYSDRYSVFMTDGEGNVTTIVKSPFWWTVVYGGFLFIVPWAFLFFGAIAFNVARLVLGLIRKMRGIPDPEVIETRTRAVAAGPAIVASKLALILNYNRINAAVHAALTAAVLVTSPFAGAYTPVLIFPAALHVMISSVVLMNRYDDLRAFASDADGKRIKIWTAAKIVTFLILFIACVVAAPEIYEANHLG